ncbi:hypothetical protein PtrEW13061_012053, partial [Pyrenophora tritici-repentis]
MAPSSAAAERAPLQEWFVICPDFDGVLEKRLKVHLSRLKQDPDDFWLWGGPMLEEEEVSDGDGSSARVFFPSQVDSQLSERLPSYM